MARIKRLKGTTRLDAAIRGAASLVDFGAVTHVQARPSKSSGSVVVRTANPGRTRSHRAELPASKLAGTFHGIELVMPSGVAIDIKDLVRTKTEKGQIVRQGTVHASPEVTVRLASERPAKRDA